MKAFSGFASGKVRTLNIPEPVFTELLPLIDDLDELKLTIHALYLLTLQQTEIRYLRHDDLLTDSVLLESLSEPIGAVVERALALAVERGTLLRAEVEEGERQQTIYFVNSPKGRASLEAARRGEPLSAATPVSRPNVFVLYEENIGPLTPIISEELQEAEGRYPPEWIEDAFREAVSLNKRSWKYIRAILERWRAEGRTDETDRRGSDQDRRRYIEGKYGEYIKR